MRGRCLSVEFKKGRQKRPGEVRTKTTAAATRELSFCWTIRKHKVKCLRLGTMHHFRGRQITLCLISHSEKTYSPSAPVLCSPRPSPPPPPLLWPVRGNKWAHRFQTTMGTRYTYRHSRQECQHCECKLKQKNKPYSKIREPEEVSSQTIPLAFKHMTKRTIHSPHSRQAAGSFKFRGVYFTGIFIGLSGSLPVRLINAVWRCIGYVEGNLSRGALWALLNCSPIFVISVHSFYV